MLQRSRGGGALAVLSALLAVATLLPVLSVEPLAVFASGLLFGVVFLSLVAATTSLVRHNLAPAAWPAGIAAFTIIFAAGQIVGPSLVGFIADHFGGLRAGLVCSVRRARPGGCRGDPAAGRRPFCADVALVVLSAGPWHGDPATPRFHSLCLT